MSERPTVVRLERERDEARAQLSEAREELRSVGRDVLDLRAQLARVRQENHDLHLSINTPQVDDFLDAVRLEAAHQRERWGTEHDAGKADADWFWLIGYLAGKALRPGQTLEKRLHHIITTAAVCMNWHAHATGADTRMRPGIAPPAEGAAQVSDTKPFSTTPDELVHNLTAVDAAARAEARANTELSSATLRDLVEDRDKLRAELQAARDLLAEERKHLLADEERRKLTGDALFAEGELAALREQHEALRAAADAVVDAWGKHHELGDTVHKLNCAMLATATPEPQPAVTGDPQALLAVPTSENRPRLNATATHGHQYATREDVGRLEAALRLYLYAVGSGWAEIGATDALAMLDARKQEGGG